MRKELIVLLCLALAVGLTACGEKTMEKDVFDNMPAELPPPPPEPTGTTEETMVETTETVAPATDEAEMQDDPTEVFSGDEERKVVGGISNVKCNVEERKITFTVHNEGEHTWSLDQTAGFGDQSVDNLKVFINNHESNRKSAQYEAGERLFGPSETYSENCNGVDEIPPGGTATCTLYPVPLKPADDYVSKNRIWLDVTGDIEYVTFTCE